jgi:uncharacterized protein YxjI
VHYLIREKASALSREHVVENDDGKMVFRAHGPVVRVRDEIHVDDAAGAQQFLIKEPLLGGRRSFAIYRTGGARCADVTAIATGNLLDGFDVQGIEGAPLHARGDVLGRAFTIAGSHGVVADIRRKDAHVLVCDIAPGQDDPLLLASVLAIGAMTDAWAQAGIRQH